METWTERIAELNAVVNSFVWGPPMLILILSIGILMTVRTRFFQVTKFGYMLKQTIVAAARDKKIAKTQDKNNISQFQALATALAGTIGTGNIVGVAMAVSSGGPGAVFWMWVSAFLGMMTNYAENVLGIYYRRRGKNGEYIGGPMIYIERGVGWKWMAMLFSLFCLIASFGIGNMAQVNGISTAVQSTFGTSGRAFVGFFTELGFSLDAAVAAAESMPGLIIGVLTAILVGIVILGGIKRIALVAEKLVPSMAVFYILGALVIIFAHVGQVPSAFMEIFEGAFSLKSAGSGAAGYVMAQAVRYGIARGVFSNEAGLGSSVMVHANADVKEPVQQGMWGMFEVFFDTIVMCTLTALAVILTGAHHQGLDGVNITTYAFTSVLGNAGGYVIAVGTLLFAFATILGWSVYGTRAAQYLFHGSPAAVLAYKMIYIVMVIVGAVSSIQTVWNLSDAFNGLMALPNLMGVFLLSPVVIKITKNYTDRFFKGKKIQPILSCEQEELHGE